MWKHDPSAPDITELEKEQSKTCASPTPTANSWSTSLRAETVKYVACSKMYVEALMSVDSPASSTLRALSSLPSSSSENARCVQMV